MTKFTESEFGVIEITADSASIIWCNRYICSAYRTAKRTL
jgi:hypothetical protein